MGLFGLLKRSAAAFAFMATAAQAQFIADGIDLDTAAGSLSVTDAADGFSRALTIGNRAYFGDEGYRIVSIEDQRGTLFLIGLSSGGNACEVGYVWVHTAGGDVRFSDQFGNCAPKTEVRSDAETVTVVMPSVLAADGFVEYVYDGEQVRETVLGQQDLGVPRTADALIGLYPFEVFRNAGWRAPLTALMGEASYRRAGEVIATSSPFEMQGDWVAGTGFNNRLKGNAVGAIAIHRTDGRVVVALRTEENGLELWGDMSGSVPLAITLVMNAG
jgi:hypothetical protein